MKHIAEMIVARRNFFFAILLWGLLMLVPWGQLPRPDRNLILLFASDMLRLALALTLFIAPGMGLFLLLRPSREDGNESVGLIPIGFALSIAMISVIGLLGRVLGFSFIQVLYLFTLLGMCIFVRLLFSTTGPDYRAEKFTRSLREMLKAPSLLLALILVIALTFHDYLFFLDDATYGAYITNWQYSSCLGFQNLIHDPNTIEHIRFWLALFPMSQSLLADLSGVPGLLLLGNYLELFLTPLAVITLYWFGTRLGLSSKAAGFSALMQVVLFAYIQGDQRPVGRWFYQSLAEDKVAAVFLLSPILFALALDFHRLPSRRNLTLVIVCGLGLMLTHPVILFIACIIALGMALFAKLSKQSTWRSVLTLGLVFLGLMAPYALIRAADSAGYYGGPYDGRSAADTYEIELYVNYLDDMFYGMNPGVLELFDLPPENGFHEAYQFIRIIPIVFLLLGGILALIHLKRGSLVWYLAAVNGLIFFAILPYTGWMLGYFISARLLYRIAWFAPLGMSMSLILISIRDWIAGRIRRGWDIHLSSRISFLGLFSCLLVAIPILLFNVVTRVPAYFQILERNRQLAQVGAYIDRHSNGLVTVIALDYNDLQLIPTISSHSLLISFREEQDYNGFNNFMPLEEVHERIHASNIIRSLAPQIPTDERCQLIRQYEVRLILVRAIQAGNYPALVGACGINLIADFATDDYVLFRVK